MSRQKKPGDNENRSHQKQIARRAGRSEIVDCRSQARRWTRAARSDPDWLALLAHLALDPEANLTDLESADWGDADSWGDMAEVSTYRYMPLRALHVDAVLTMVLWGGLTPIAAKLALALLDRDPLEGGDAVDGVLLDYAVGALVALEASENRDTAAVAVLRRALEKAHNAAVRILLDRLHAIASERGEDPGAIVRKVESGWIAGKHDPYADPVDTRQKVARAGERLRPSKLLSVSDAKVLFRARPGYEHVADRVARPGDEKLEDWNLSDFPDIVREVRFEIVSDRSKGVRLRYIANPPTVLENRVGEVFPDAEAACQAMQKRFGLPMQAWEVPRSGAK